MQKIDNAAIIKIFALTAASKFQYYLREIIAEVNVRAEHHAVGPGADKTGRVRDYDATPGSVSQSHGAWLKAVRDRLIDGLQALLRKPEDLEVQQRFLVLSALYSSAGDAFAEIVVSADAFPDGDPLMRPSLPEKRGSKLRALRGRHLSSEMQDVVLDAAADDPKRVAAACFKLKDIIATEGHPEAEMAVALLGNIGDPINRSKINRMAEEITRIRWAGPSAMALPKVMGNAAGPAGAATGAIRSQTSDVPPASESEVVVSGGDDARRLTVNTSASRYDDLAALYGEEE